MEAFHRGGEIWECWNCVEQTGDAERVIHTARRTDQSEAAAFAGESGALTDQSADARAIHLNEAAEIDEQFFATAGGDALKFAVEEFAIFAERGAAARLDDHDVAIGASVDFEFWMFDVHMCDSILLELNSRRDIIRRRRLCAIPKFREAITN